jgi:hypothetical protein
MEDFKGSATAEMPKAIGVDAINITARRLLVPDFNLIGY